jgi:photosystem II stability/assembly factor-like uncharacterized protein
MRRRGRQPSQWGTRGAGTLRPLCVALGALLASIAASATHPEPSAREPQVSKTVSWAQSGAPALPGWPTSLPGPSGITSWVERDHPFLPAALNCFPSGSCTGLSSNGAVAVSGNWGATWEEEALPRVAPGVPHNFTLISCPSQARCWLAGSDLSFGPAYVLATVDGGREWSAQALPGFKHGIAVSVNALACPAPNTCAAVGSAGLAAPVAYIASTHNGGRSWVASLLPRATPVLQRIACPTADKCLALGWRDPKDQARPRLLSSSDGGLDWHVIGTLPRLLWRVADLACFSASSCVVVGNERPKATSPVIYPDNSSIYVGPPVAAYTTDWGAAWKLSSMPKALAGPVELTCVGSGACWSAGQTARGLGAALARSANGGASWAEVPFPAGSPDVQPMDCLNAVLCFAPTPAGVLVSDNGGRRWWTTREPATTPANMYDTPAEVSCASAHACMVTTRFLALAGGGSAPPFPLVLYSHDGGAKWHGSDIDNGEDQFSSGISCATAARCWAATSTSIFSTTDGGATWAPDYALGAVHRPTSALAPSISCPTVVACVATGLGAGTEILSTADGGLTWAVGHTPAVHGYLDGVSCASAAYCWAVGPTTVVPGPGSALVLATTDGGRTWGQEATPAGTGALAAISCPTLLNCVAVGGGSSTAQVIYTADGGHSWLKAATPPGTGELLSVSCPTRTDCAAGGPNAAMYSENGGRTWNFEPLPSGTDGITGVSCATANDCTAVGMYSILTTTDGGRPLH